MIYQAEAMAEAPEAPDYRWQNEKLLLKVIKEKLGITDEDMKTPDVVKQKLRESNITEILS
jgi:hypothetical protein